MPNAGPRLPIRIASPVIGDEEVEAATTVLRSGLLAQGREVAALETQFGRVAGTAHAVAVSSGTAALHTALVATGIGPGDQVITSPFTFIATANAVKMCGAGVRFADIDPVSFCLDAAAVEGSLTPATKAILAVGLYGQPYDWAGISAVARRHGLLVIEDAAQSVGATFDGRPSGSLGDVACFSLYATKNIMCGEGGVITTDDADIDRRARLLRQHGMRGRYDYEGLGYNYRLTDLAASVANAQLSRLGSIIARRQRNAATLSSLLAGIPGLVLPTVAPGRTHVWHQYTVRITDDCAITREQLSDALQHAQVDAFVYYPSTLHHVPHLADEAHPAGSLPKAERACREVLSLPVHASLTDADVAYVADAVRSACVGGTGGR